MEFQTVLRDSEWIFIIEPLYLQFEHEHATGGSALQAWSQDPNQRRRRRKGEEFKGSEPVKKKKEESRFISGFQSQNQQQNQDRRILKVQNRISEQNQGKNQKNLPLSYAWTSVSPNQRRSVRVQKVRFKKNETLTFFQNRKGFQGLQRESTVVNPWIHEKFHQNEDLNQKRTKEPIETREEEFQIYSDSVNTCEFQ